MSKMTVKNEIEKAYDYYKLLFAEFCEFIGRIAYQKYKALDVHMSEKIIHILGEIFTHFNLTVDEVEVEEVEESESDKDY